MKKIKKISTMTRIIAIVCVLLLLVNFALGFVLYNQSKNAMKTLIEERMIYISSTAASSVDAEALASLTEEDVGSEKFESIKADLTVFQSNFASTDEVSDFEYIYAIRQIDEDTFVFTVDPDPDEPADFGDKTVTTDALIEASRGTPAIDYTAAEDEWGRYYTAYSPVKDSAGNIVGIIGVDFNAQWYEAQLTKHASSIIIVSFISLAVGALVVTIITGRLRERFRTLGHELTALSYDVDELTGEIMAKPEFENLKLLVRKAEKKNDEWESGDAVEQIDRKIRLMRSEVGKYLTLMREQAYTDIMSGMNNRSAYIETTEKIAQRIESGDIEFSVAVFDINALKEINDTYGHEAGDAIIVEAADILKKVFGSEFMFRTGGDEFVAILENMSDAQVAEKFAQIDKKVKEFNDSDRPHPFPLSFSKGRAVFDRDKDIDYHAVFIRADEAMYDEKNEFYISHGERRRHQTLFHVDAPPSEDK